MFDSSHFNKLMSLQWFVRKNNLDDVDVLVTRYGYDRGDSEFVVEQVWEECLSPEEFYKLIKTNGLPSSKRHRLDLAS